jgi:hypothetical protein
MTLRIRFNILCYILVLLTWGVLWFLGSILIWFSIFGGFFELLFFVAKFVRALGIHSSSELLKVGAFFMSVSLPILLLSWVAYDGYSARFICKKLNSDKLCNQINKRSEVS